MENLTTREISKSGDPSENKQDFKPLAISLLCARYWWFEIWKGQKMAFPFWRLYWNKNEGAYVFFEKMTDLKPDHVYLIAPNTPFSNGIHQREVAGDPAYFFKCGQIESEGMEQAQGDAGNILHFFTHFTLGYPYAEAKPGVYPLPLTPERRQLLEQVIRHQYTDSSQFTAHVSLALYHLVVSAISALPENTWSARKAEPRILDSLDFMQRHLGSRITCESLAERLHLSPGAFSRLFKQYIRKSPSKHLLALRLEQASNLLLHTHASIESIAQQCGFVDRYHFTKAFTKAYRISPAAFRKGAGYF